MKILRGALGVSISRQFDRYCGCSSCPCSPGYRYYVPNFEEDRTPFVEWFVSQRFEASIHLTGELTFFDKDSNKLFSCTATDFVTELDKYRSLL